MTPANVSHRFSAALTRATARAKRPPGSAKARTSGPAVAAQMMTNLPGDKTTQITTSGNRGANVGPLAVVNGIDATQLQHAQHDEVTPVFAQTMQHRRQRANRWRLSRLAYNALDAL